ncbi:MAG: hypothetical protein PQJ46_02420 [Spirochaetales bacterium]|nr:hypothetical protein [Spirochaetales bacterium]
MLIIKKSALIISGIFITAATAAVSILAYIRIESASEKTPQELQFIAERYLFNGLLITIAIVIIFIFLITKSRNIIKELDKIIKRKQIDSDSIEKSLNRLGACGKKIQSLFTQINTISEKRKQKISVMNNTIEKLSHFINEKVAVIDLNGQIIYTGNSVFGKEKLGRKELKKNNISLITGKIHIKPIISNLEKKNIPLVLKQNGKSFKWIPVFNENNEISCIIVKQEL